MDPRWHLSARLRSSQGLPWVGHGERHGGRHVLSVPGAVHLGGAGERMPLRGYHL